MKIFKPLDMIKTGFFSLIFFMLLFLTFATDVKATIATATIPTSKSDLPKTENESQLKTNTYKSKAVKSKINAFIIKQKDKSDYEKIVNIHDYVISNAEMSGTDSDDVYAVLINGVGSAKGYSETLKVLFDLLGIDNQIVKASSNSNTNSVHYFNKVKFDGDWYNIDAAVDDPILDNKDNNIVRTYLLVSDRISKQRYEWDYTNYPASETENNWHMRSGFVVNSQKALDKFIDKNIKQKETFFSVWIDDYSNTKYKVERILGKHKDIEFKAIYTPSINSLDNTCSTALIFYVIYN